MTRLMLKTALCLIFVSLSSLSSVQSQESKNKLVLHSESNKSQAPHKNVDTQNFLLLYIGELGTGDLYIKISKSDHSLKAALLDKKQNILWEVPAASEQVTISDSKRFFVVVSNANYPYYMHEDGKIQLKGFSCFDAAGNILFSVPNTNFISQIFIADNTQIVLLTKNGLVSYNMEGKQTWNFESRLAEAEADGNGTLIKTMQGNLSDNHFQVNLIDARTGLVMHSWNYIYGNELRLMHVNAEKNWLLMTVENGSDWTLNLIDMKTWQVITSVSGLQSGIFSPVWNAKDESYGFIFYKGDNHSAAVPALGVLNCKDFSFESLNVGVQKLDLNNDQLKLIPIQNLYSFITVDSVKNYKVN